MESGFESKIKPIRPKTLRKFLKLYYYAYVKKNGEFLAPLFNVELVHQARKEGIHWPSKIKTWPGIRFTKMKLSCSKATAQDYLRACDVTDEYFVKPMQHLVNMKRKNFNKLLKELGMLSENAAKSLGAKDEKVSKKAILQTIRNLMRDAAERVERVSNKKKKEGKGKEGFTPEECSKILRELASRLLP